MTDAPDAKATFNEMLKNKLVQDSAIDANIAENWIVTTKDKLRLGIRDHSKALSDKKGWIAPASLFATIIATILTAEFKKDFLLPAATWHAAFVLGAIGTFAWTIWALLAARNIKVDEDSLIDRICISTQRAEAKSGSIHATAQRSSV